MRNIILHILFLILSTAVNTIHEQTVSIAFYNTENMADTIANDQTGNYEFTPTGKYRWDSDKYLTKVHNIARVIDDLNADIIGLCEIENENVLRDLMYSMNTSYNYIYRPTNDMRGMDIALLYRGDTFFPEHIRQIGGHSVPREFLAVKGKIYETEMIFIVCHLPSQANKPSYRENAAKRLGSYMEQLKVTNPDLPIIIMGDFNMTPESYLARKILNIHSANSITHYEKQRYFTTPFTALSQKGYGSYIYKDKRQMYDFIILSNDCITGSKFRLTDNYGIFVREYMIHNKGMKKGYPIRSFDSGKYEGGYSDHLPVFITLDAAN